MATATAVKDKSTKVKEKPAERSSKKKLTQKTLPGVQKGVPELDKIAVKALDAKDQQKEWKEKFDDCIHKLLSTMRKLKIYRYIDGGIEVERLLNDETVKVKRVKQKRA